MIKSHEFTDFIHYKLAEFWNERRLWWAKSLTMNLYRIYYKVIFVKLNTANDYLRLSTSALRENNAERAIRMLEMGLIKHPHADILFENYIKICCEQEQFARAINFIREKKNKLTCALVYQHSPEATPDSQQFHQQRYDLIWLSNELIRKNFDKITMIWQLVELLEKIGHAATAKTIYNHLSKCTATTQDDYLLSAVSDFRTGNTNGGLVKLALGLTRSYKYRSLLQECLKFSRCYFDFNLHLQMKTILHGKNFKRKELAFEFYKDSVNANPSAVFIINFRDIEFNCHPKDFVVLKELFLESFHNNELTLEVAKVYVYYSVLLDVDADFSEKIYQRIYSRKWGDSEAEDKATKYLLHLLRKLSLPLGYYHTPPTENIIREFIANAKMFKQQSISLTEPISDFGAYYASWQAVFCIVQPRLYKQAISAWGKLAFKLWPRLDYTAPHISCPAVRKISHKRVRIGFTCLDTMPMLSGFLEHLDQDIFETIFLRPGKKQETKTADDWVARADATIEYSDTNAYLAIETIAKQELDILISGPSIPSIFFPLMARLAHLHMVLLEPNWPDGLKNLDYYISWQPAEPTNCKDFYKTPVSLMNHPPYWIEKPSMCRAIPISDRTVHEIRQRLLGFGLKERFYICANTPPKIHPAMDDIFCKLLEKDPGSHLVLLRGENVTAQPLKARLKEKLGPLFKRVVFVNTLKMEDAHSLLLSADCCIDSYPICGMSSSFDGCMLGVPIVTLPADIPFGRWTAAIYDYIGISGLTAKSMDDYIDIALRLANDKAWRLKLSAEIREKSARYIESKASFDEFQNFIIQAWRRKQNGLPPANWVAGEWQCCNELPNALAEQVSA